MSVDDHKTCTDKERMTTNDLRTHLSNERTFLAWCRTSIAIIAFAFVIKRFDFIINAASKGTIETTAALHHELNYISLFAFVLGGLIVLISGYRFLALRKMIRRGEMSISIFPEIMVIVSMVIIIIMVIVLMFR